jgi:hypothetical protein
MSVKRIVARICVVFGFVTVAAATVNAQATAGPGGPQRASPSPTLIYFVLHAHVDPTQPTFPLSAEGRLRAEAFARTVTSVSFTHIFSSHTTRARQMVEPVAQAQKLVVRQVPALGEMIDGAVVSDATRSQVATVPLVETLRRLPAGSTALVGLNSDNIYAVMNGLGVPAATPGQPCTAGSACVPCLSNACITPTFDQFWILVLGPEAKVPRLIELRYGAPFAK